MGEFDKFYESDAASHGKRYFDLMKDFFQGYAKFSQRLIPLRPGAQNVESGGTVRARNKSRT
jgi:hypothetical protein